jgi:hypothetical protein
MLFEQIMDTWYGRYITQDHVNGRKQHLEKEQSVLNTLSIPLLASRSQVARLGLLVVSHSRSRHCSRCGWCFT